MPAPKHPTVRLIHKGPGSIKLDLTIRNPEALPEPLRKAVEDIQEYFRGLRVRAVIFGKS